MGILRDAEVELGHVIAKICQTLAAFTIQKTRTHLGQVFATCSQIVFILRKEEINLSASEAKFKDIPLG